MCWEFSWGQQRFSWPFSPITETLFQSESFPSGPTLPEETEAKVRKLHLGKGRTWGGPGAAHTVSVSGRPGK